jgi:uncharacterized membrane protein YbhN (UPF0104 family)
MTSIRTRLALLLSVVVVAVLAAAAVSPRLLQTRVSAGLTALGGASPHWLGLAGIAFVTAFACTVGAWRAALAAAGGRICTRQAASRLGVGALVNAVAPAKLGDALKIALCARAIDNPERLWTTGGVYAALAGARALALAALLVAASATGALPLWPVFALCGAVAVFAAVPAFSSRWRRHLRLTRLLDGLAALEHSPRALGAVLGWTFAMAASRLAGTAAVTMALGLPHPLLAALVVMPVLDFAGIVPITPGGLGIGTGAVAMALASRGIGGPQALGVGIAMQAVETLVSLIIGGLGTLYLLGPRLQTQLQTRLQTQRWTARLTTGNLSAAVVSVGVQRRSVPSSSA